MLFANARSERNARRAAQFVARLYSGEMTAADEEALQHWLAADGSHRDDYEAALALHETGGALAEEPSLASLAARDANVGDNSRTKRWWGARTATLAASVAVTIGVIATFMLRAPVLELARYETSVGERRDVLLADGTRLTLNTNTRVVVDYSLDRRRLILDYGEIFLDVARNKARPLTVQLGARAVTVLGTKFNVYRNGEDLSVAVVEGRVAVHPSDRPFAFEARARVAAEAAPQVNSSAAPTTTVRDAVILDAGAIATFSGAQIESRRLAEAELTETWRNGVVRFDEEPLFRVIREMNRYSTKKVLIEDAAVMELPISGVFQPAQIEVVLASLEQALPVRIIDYPDRYVIISRKSSVPDAASMNASTQKATTSEPATGEGR